MGHENINTTLKYYISGRADEKKTKCNSSKKWYDYLNCKKMVIIEGKKE